MFTKVVCTIALMVVLCQAEPGVQTPVVAPAVVTAQSSQVIARNYNGLYAAPVAPVVAAPFIRAPLVRSAPIVAAAPVAYAAPHYHPYYSPYVAQSVLV